MNLKKIDIEKDSNDFFPHITLARIKYPQTHTRISIYF